MIGATLIEKTNSRLVEQLGPLAFKAKQLSMRKSDVKKQQYSMSLIAAITRDKLLCTQVLEGAFDATLFEEVVYQMLVHVRTDQDTANKTVVLFMDNASIHHHSEVLKLC